MGAGQFDRVDFSFPKLLLDRLNSPGAIIVILTSSARTVSCRIPWRHHLIFRLIDFSTYKSFYESADVHHSNLNIKICRPDTWRDVLTLNSQLLTVPFCSMH